MNSAAKKLNTKGNSMRKKDSNYRCQISQTLVSFLSDMPTKRRDMKRQEQLKIPTCEVSQPVCTLCSSPYLQNSIVFGWSRSTGAITLNEMKFCVKEQMLSASLITLQVMPPALGKYHLHCRWMQINNGNAGFSLLIILPYLAFSPYLCYSLLFCIPPSLHFGEACPSLQTRRRTKETNIVVVKTRGISFQF